MRYPASEKLEIIRLVERSHLPVRRTLDKLGIPATTFYRWYDGYRAFGEAGLEGRTSGPGRVWNRIPDDVRRQVVDLALDEPELSPRELAVTFTDTRGYFVSEAPVYRPLKAHDPITSPAFVVIKAASEFKDKTTAPNQLWQTDFTSFKVICWGWFYLSTILDDYSIYIIAWKLCTTRKARLRPGNSLVYPRKPRSSGSFTPSWNGAVSGRNGMVEGVGLAGSSAPPGKDAACTSPATCWPMPAARAGASSPPSPRRTPTARRPSGVRSPTSSGPRCPSWQFSWTKPSTTSSPT